MITTALAMNGLLVLAVKQVGANLGLLSPLLIGCILGYGALRALQSRFRLKMTDADIEVSQRTAAGERSAHARTRDVRRVYREPDTVIGAFPGGAFTAFERRVEHVFVLLTDDRTVRLVADIERPEVARYLEQVLVAHLAALPDRTSDDASA
ncbi:MAG: hypothetical protein K0S65_1738 [Labilithrix sp.]|nr:hypothetical protein [Labilithrix sp.]